MSTQLALYERIPDPTAGAAAMGTAIAKSGMFGCSSIDQGVVFGWECLARGIPPLMLAERYHIIFGKLSMKAEAMLAGFEQQGGKYKVTSRTPDLVAMEMTIGGETYNVALSWEEAQNEPFCYDGKEADIVKRLTSGNANDRKKLEFKPKYATPRARTQMLWARLVSDSVRFLAPNVVSGVYTPEEIEDFDENQNVINGKAKAASGNGSNSNGNGHATASVSQKPTASVVESADVIEGEAVAKPAAEVATKSNPATPATPPAESDRCSKATRDKIQKLFLQIGISPEKQNEIIRKRGVGALAALTTAQADELLLNLEAKAAAIAAAGKVEAESIAGESKAVPSIQTTPASPCTPAQIDKCKQLLAEHKQNDGTFNARLKERLLSSGKQKIADLSEADANRLIEFLELKAAEKFFEISLEVCAAIKADDEAAKGESATTASESTASEGESKN